VGNGYLSALREVFRSRSISFTAILLKIEDTLMLFGDATKTTQEINKGMDGMV
jgi:hypothetical protein